MLLKIEEIRKQLHDQIQIYRGNLRIFCRVKPVFELDQSQKLILNIPQFAVDNAKSQIIELNDNQKTVNFFFDRVFDMECTQNEIFSEILPFIQSSIDGQKCCILAYGQTGTGKTYTMQGPDGFSIYGEEGQEFERVAGILPRTVQFVFQEKNRLCKQGNDFEFLIGIVEIYKDDLTDLLNPSNVISIVTKQNHTEIANLTLKQINVTNDFVEILKNAELARKTQKTCFNERSSRSHCIYIMKIKVNSMKQYGILNIVDLAGSEKNIIKHSTGQMNVLFNFQGLTTLGRIIRLLSDKSSSNIPYRECKLTRVLQDSLSSSGKTIMFINVSPLIANIGMTKESLKFASKAAL